ncbi:MAG: Mu transposase C-terminal domain-containing protein [Alphaproteobacteria bacterium]|nr:Mu transposase C-terminal domain-containing protein [Alphaproteobacteria bacterium]
MAIPHFVSVNDIVGLPGMPDTIAGVQAYIRRHAWSTVNYEQGGELIRKRQGKGGGYEYAIDLLPEAVRAALTVAPSQAQTDKRTALWQVYNDATITAKTQAMARAEAVRAVEHIARGNTTITEARQKVAGSHGVSVSSLARFAQLTKNVASADYPAALVGDYKGVGGKKQAIASDLIEMAHTLYYRPEQPSFAQVYRELAVMAASQGWTLPKERTLQRRVVRDANKDMATLARKGRKALEDTTSMQRRDVRHLHPMEVVNADYRRFDLFVTFDDGEVARPQVCIIQDVRTSMMLAARIEKTANSTGVRLAMLDVCGRFGVPSKLYIDNGREFASTVLTAGSINRNRHFGRKINAPAPIDGVFKGVGMDIHFTQPYSGRSKPIERGFRDLASDVDKDPRLAGAYVGNNPLAKPDNYKGKDGAVPLALFEQVLADKVTEHNTRQGRQGRDYAGRSFVEVFAEGYEAAQETGKIQPASQAHLDMLRLESKPIKVKRNGEVRLLGTDYGHITLREHAGESVIARFDPDDLAQPVSVYDARGRMVCIAEPIGTVRFDDVDAARETLRARKQIVKAAKEQDDAIKRIGISQAASVLARAYEDRTLAVEHDNAKVVPFRLPSPPSPDDPIIPWPPTPPTPPTPPLPPLPSLPSPVSSDPLEQLKAGLARLEQQQ